MSLYPGAHPGSSRDTDKYLPELPQTEGPDLSVEQGIRELPSKFASNLKKRMGDRVREMEDDDKSHFLIYQVPGVTYEEGHLIDVYQNKGRFLYKYAGSFLENAARTSAASARATPTPT
ncbi:ApaLI family restriction endonuclease [bacterium]|nr:ApaLI family restriction endonuclease [bacterium]